MYRKVNFAFSIAEAFIMLTIVSVALAAAAPMVSKQIKYNNLSNVQTNLLGRKIDRVEDNINANRVDIRDIVGEGRTPEQYAQYIVALESRVSALEGIDIERLSAQLDSKVDVDDLAQEVANQTDNFVDNSTLNNKADSIISSLSNKIATEIKKLQDEFKNKLVPSGAIVFFNSNNCPDNTNWMPLTSIYPQASGAFIRNLGETNRAKGSYQAGAVPDIQLALRVDYNGGSRTDKIASYGNDDNNCGSVIPNGGADEPMYRMDTVSVAYRAGDLIKTNPDVYDKNVKEVRPNNIAFIACVKK